MYKYFCILYQIWIIEPSLTAEKLEEYKNQMQETELDDVYLPKFEFDTKYFMKETLSSLGMPTAFSGTANFSGMTLAEQLFIDQVIHQAYIKVDEEGTEAAAITSIGVSLTSMPQTTYFRVDRPFIFVIRDHHSNTILFIGKVLEL